jgi:hypothetical protein
MLIAAAFTQRKAVLNRFSLWAVVVFANVLFLQIMALQDLAASSLPMVASDLEPVSYGWNTIAETLWNHSPTSNWLSGGAHSKPMRLMLWGKIIQMETPVFHKCQIWGSTFLQHSGQTWCFLNVGIGILPTAKKTKGASTTSSLMPNPYAKSANTGNKDKPVGCANCNITSFTALSEEIAKMSTICKEIPTLMWGFQH